MRDTRTILAALVAALAKEEAHGLQRPTTGLFAYCAEARELRETVRRLRREAEAALREETAA